MRIFAQILCLAVGAAGCVGLGEATSATSEASAPAIVSVPAVPRDLPPKPPVAAAGCAPTVEALPAAAYLGADDARLRSPDLVVVSKGSRRIGRYREGRLVGDHCYRVGLGQGADAAVGPKRVRGDRKTPEGWYRTSDKPWSQFYAAIAVHYPNGEDARAGRAAGHLEDGQVGAIEAAVARGAKPPQDTPLGGEILIHGGGGSSDWTLGCMAMDDRELDALRASLPADQQFDLLILP